MKTYMCRLHGLEPQMFECWEVTYAIVDYGDGPRCAWCKKKSPSKFHLEVHDKFDKIKRFFHLL